ncbi:nodulin MtN21 /EamA-like transporter family protein [Euphorbia peplus]|nr:nodulin MtN21 /EamA-like transporter family protein [Euphorbia peplus]
MEMMGGGIMSMVLVQVFATGMQILAKIILNNGSFVFALMAYRHIVAAFCLAPFALLLERDIHITQKLSWVVFFWLFLNALTGISLPMSLFYYGLRDTTATYAVNFLNLIPILTFVLSIIMRIEKLKLGSREGKMKSFGAILCVGGAFISCFYKGKSFFIIHKTSQLHHININHQTTHWIRGSLALIASCFSYASWYILQVKMMKILPSKYWTTMLTCIIASVQSIIVGLLLDTSKTAWQLGWNLQLATILYSGAFGTAATFCLIAWAVAKWGPTYPPMFNPLTLLFVAFSDALIFRLPIHLGNLLGMILIIVGLYSFLFGRRMETRNLPKPLLQHPQIVALNVHNKVAAESMDVPPQTIIIVK